VYGPVLRIQTLPKMHVGSASHGYAVAGRGNPGLAPVTLERGRIPHASNIMVCRSSMLVVHMHHIASQHTHAAFEIRQQVNPHRTCLYFSVARSLTIPRAIRSSPTSGDKNIVFSSTCSCISLTGNTPQDHLIKFLLDYKLLWCDHFALGTFSNLRTKTGYQP
jgi:hypothetical protein